MTGIASNVSGGDALPGELAALRLQAPEAFVEAVLARLDLGVATAPAGLAGVREYVRVDRPYGDLYVVYGDAGISHVFSVALVGATPAEFESMFAGAFGETVRPGADPPAGLLEALESGDGRSLRFDLRTLRPFQRAVLEKALEIPAGEVRPYGWIAREIGHPKAVRAVGTALGRNPVPVLIPCHRVVRTDGRIGNYGLGTPMKHGLLCHEGVDVAGLEKLAAAGVQLVGSAATRVFCHPTCRHARIIAAAETVRFHDAGQAVAAGYRPCPHCRPARLTA